VNHSLDLDQSRDCNLDFDPTLDYSLDCDPRTRAQPRHPLRRNSFFTELLPRLKSIELAGDPQFVATTFVGGIKHLPVRYSVT
jgi:hypothetical protein